MGKRNAKEEFLGHIQNYKVIAANISFDYYDNDEYSQKEYKLKPGYSKSDYENFLKFLDRDYNCGYGGQELFGIIYCEDGVWIDRGEYDGSEWYNVHKYPDLSEVFDKSDILRYERSKKLLNIKKVC